jgi:fructoselysine transporter
MQSASPSHDLHRSFGLLHATAMNMSNMVGIGPFLTIPLPSVIALVGWLFIFATSGIWFIAGGLGTMAAGVVAYLAWSVARRLGEK